MELNEVLFSDIIENKDKHYNIFHGRYAVFPLIDKLIKNNNRVCYGSKRWDNLQYFKHEYGNHPNCKYLSTLHKIHQLIKHKEIDLLITTDYFGEYTTHIYDKCKEYGIRYICITWDISTYVKNKDVISIELNTQQKIERYIRKNKIKKLLNVKSTT